MIAFKLLIMAVITEIRIMTAVMIVTAFIIDNYYDDTFVNDTTFASVVCMMIMW